MASILVMTEDGRGLGLASQLAEEKHVVRIWMRDSAPLPLLNGVKNPMRIWNIGVPEQYDLVLSLSGGLGEQEEALRQERPVIAGGAFAQKLNEDLDYQRKVISSLVKLERVPNSTVAEPLPLIYITGWFNTEAFQFFNYCIPYMRLMEGNKGPVVDDSMGSVIWRANRNDEIVKSSLLPVESLLRKVQYIGPLTAEIGFDSERMYCNSLQCGMRFDSTEALYELYMGSLFDLFWRLHVKDSEWKLWGDYSISVRLSLAPYPNQGGEFVDTNEFVNMNDGARPHTFLGGVKSVIGCVTARGHTIQEVRRRAYRTISNIVKNAEVQYRLDIGAGVEKMIECIKTWGWAVA